MHHLSKQKNNLAVAHALFVIRDKVSAASDSKKEQPTKNVGSVMTFCGRELSLMALSLSIAHSCSRLEFAKLENIQIITFR